MVGGEADPVVWAVAGCLFEISVPEIGGTSWTWVDPQPEVTLLSDSVRADGHHFRFRAEAAAAVAGEVRLRFRSRNAVQAVVMRVVVVRVAPECDAAELAT
ncbi:MAG TPA: hypothetical protein VHT97_14180 [Acidimicrobiales bacterium]|jgi:hypothetical protein|nr:hypothetical protein [Acidimicrobiales bacterium]